MFTKLEKFNFRVLDFWRSRLKCLTWICLFLKTEEGANPLYHIELVSDIN